MTGRQSSGPSMWVFFWIFLALLVVALIIQGATVHKIGFGPLSIEFDKSQPGGSGGGNPGSSIDFPAGIFGGSRDFSRAKGVTGSWKQRQGELTVEVTQVDNQDGFLRLHAKVTNGSPAAMVLPLFGRFTAVDNADQTHDPDVRSSAWHDSVPANGFVTGTINLTDKVIDSATKLKISFTVVFGQFAPSGITVQDIPVPH